MREFPEANQITATFELPGLTKEQVAIDVQENKLTVSGESARPTEGKPLFGERQFGKFSRTLQIPQGVKVGSFLLVFSWILC